MIWASALFVLVAIGICVLYFLIDPGLPKQTEAIINELTSSEIPELITGTTGYANSNSTNIWFERKRNFPQIKGTVLLISGLTSPASFWHQRFIQSLVDAAYEIIRFDNRSVGLSDWKWDRKNPYTIDNMVHDALVVLDANTIEKAHIVGFSMGGYIAQRLAIDYPERVLSLTTLSSSANLSDAGHPKFNWVPLPVVKLALKAP